MKTNCHCGLSQVFYKCSEYNNRNLSNEELTTLREKLESCGNRCMKNYPCEHRCTSICHSGPCPNPESCKKKMKIYCECKNLKSEITCEKYRQGFKKLPCNDNCMKIQQEQQRIQIEQEEAQRKIEEEKNRLELEMFEKKFGKKKFKERKHIEKEPEKKNYTLLWILLSGIIVLLSIFLATYVMK